MLPRGSSINLFYSISFLWPAVRLMFPISVLAAAKENPSYVLCGTEMQNMKGGEGYATFGFHIFREQVSCMIVMITLRESVCCSG